MRQDGRPNRQMREKLVFMRGEEHNEVTCVDSLRSERKHIDQKLAERP